MINRLPTFLARAGTVRTSLVLFACWTGFIGTVMGISSYWNRKEQRAIAFHRAQDSYHKDLAYRRWASDRGGVYVPMDGATPPNPYLQGLVERDVTTTSGKHLTLVNPAYMTRMVHELGEASYGLRGHLTSLKPIRPQNAPDAWERKMLDRFEQGEREVYEVVAGEDGPLLRFMGAFLVEPSCLKCHGQQGYQVGQVRGGISVTVPVGAGDVFLGLTHGGLSLAFFIAFWLVGGAGILYGTRRLVRSAREQQAMLLALDASATRFQQLFQSSPAPMLIHREGALMEVNDAAARLLEAEHPSDLVDRPFLSLVHPDFHALVSRRIEGVHATGQSAPPLEELFLTLKGREVWVEVQTTTLDLPGGRAILVFAQDLSERRKAEAERLHMEAEIQHAQKLESLGSLAGGIAHDMNNVLGAIMGVASLLEMKSAADPSLEKSLRTIQHAAGRGRDLVKGLTEFARKDLQEARALDLNALVRKELDLLERTSRQRFRFEVDLQPTPPVLGEESSLGSAFMNLAVNAFDAMPQGGILSVRTWAQKDQVILEVADTGTGIPPEILSRVTDPFFTTKAPGRGTGLGLAMVYGAMKAHGGTLEIESEVGHGTTIRLRFPSATAKAKQAAEALPADRVTSPALRILVVDDDPLIREMLLPMLEHLGHQVHLASAGLEAIRRLEAGLAVDLVILDHNMPGMTGAETLPRLFQLRPTLQVLIATGFLDTDMKLLLTDFPTVVTLQKPFTLEELRRVLGGVRASVT